MINYNKYKTAETKENFKLPIVSFAYRKMCPIIIRYIYFISVAVVFFFFERKVQLYYAKTSNNNSKAESESKRERELLLL